MINTIVNIVAIMLYIGGWLVAYPKLYLMDRNTGDSKHQAQFVAAFASLWWPFIVVAYIGYRLLNLITPETDRERAARLRRLEREAGIR